MAQIKIVASRDAAAAGRPQLRTDEETKRIVFEAARHAFAVDGYAATSTEEWRAAPGSPPRRSIGCFRARRRCSRRCALTGSIGCSPTSICRPRSRPISKTGLRAALLACADLALDPEVVALQRMVLQESATFPELAANFYSDGISRTVRRRSRAGCASQVKRKRIALDDADEAAGMMIGMVASAPQRAAIYGGMPLPSRKEIERRVQTCAAAVPRWLPRRE